MGYVNDEAMAKDLVQECFIIIWEKLPGFRNEAAIGTWIYKIASNLCLRNVEKNKKYTKSPFPDHLTEMHENAPEERIQLLYYFISQLAETDRILCSMFLENMSNSEMAVVLGMNEGNVRVRMHRIKEKLALKFKLHELLHYFILLQIYII
jgi:RNA polymerase sigma-70 factor (ECF subfamily)